MLLAELGADVVRIARRPLDEPSRAGSVSRVQAVCLDRGKTLVPPGQAVERRTPGMDRLRARADVLVSDESPGERRQFRPAGPAPELDEGLICLTTRCCWPR
jgi:crotonobetainyl-CoA:carnitine CoA-transferase CaiB-like acyl-CoA transferase